jgi:hypothetical protein
VSAFKLAVTYAAGNTQEHTGLNEAQAQIGLSAFVRDMVSLDGRGVRAVSLEIEKEKAQ